VRRLMLGYSLASAAAVGFLRRPSKSCVSCKKAVQDSANCCYLAMEGVDIYFTWYCTLKRAERVLLTPV
jgi:hypothetical protein